jgi:hypothetical protein
MSVGKAAYPFQALVSPDLLIFDVLILLLPHTSLQVYGYYPSFHNKFNVNARD